MDTIAIRNFHVSCIIGVRDWERKQKQGVIISVELFTDIRKAGSGDDLADTIDYSALHKEIRSFVENSHYFLIEALAEAIAKLCLKENKISQVKITVAKPAALKSEAYPEITIERPWSNRLSQNLSSRTE